jgi:nucleotide-binding universal stress UspA family protein
LYSKVLLTLDGSDLSRQAIPHAIAIAQATDAEVTLLQTIDSEAQMLSQSPGITIEPVPMGRITADTARDAVAAQRQAAEANLDAARAELAGAGVESVVMEIREGEPSQTIVEAVEDLGIDLVVMATSGRSGFKRALLGSVADHVVRNTPTAAVLLIRPTEE